MKKMQTYFSAKRKLRYLLRGPFNFFDFKDICWERSSYKVALSDIEDFYDDIEAKKKKKKIKHKIVRTKVPSHIPEEQYSKYTTTKVVE